MRSFGLFNLLKPLSFDTENTQKKNKYYEIVFSVFGIGK